MKRSKVLTLLLTLMAALVLLSTSVMAADGDTNNDGYHDGDVAIVQEIIKNSKWLSEHYDINDPASWAEGETYSLASWQSDDADEPMRVHFLDISSNDTRPIGFTGALNVSGLTELWTLWCYGNPGITSITLPEGDTLKYVNCEDTGITAIDVSKNPGLEFLYVSDTGITALDVSKNPKLEELYCNNTGITSLDVSNNAALGFLSCDETGITKLDLSGNPAMEYLDCYDTPLAKIITSIGTLNIQQTEGGVLHVEDIDFATGEVFLGEETEDGYGHDGWRVLPAGEEEDGSDAAFILNGDVTVSAVRHKHKYILQVDGSLHDMVCVHCKHWYALDGCPGEGYADLDMRKWYHPYTDYVLWAGYMQGYSNTVFKPEDTLSRAMLAQILYNMEGQPAVSGKDSFTDTGDNNWYTKAITWASQNGIVNGYGDGLFGPEDPVTREQMVTMFYRYAKAKGYDLTEGSLAGFTDGGQVSEFAQNAMKWAVGKGLIIGTGNDMLEPRGQSNRAEAATVITRFVEKIVG